MTALLLSLVLCASSDVSDEHAELAARLAAEKDAFDALGDEKKGLLTLLDTLEQLARESQSRSAQLERSVARARTQIAEARAAEAKFTEALQQQQRRLKPRLFTLYRLGKQDRLGALLSAHDFASLVRRQRALSTLVRSDVHELDTLATLATFQRRQATRLEHLESSAERYLRALRSEQAVGQARLSRFKDLLASVTAEQNRMSRVIAELEQSERQLSGMVKELQSAESATGFRAHRGELPFPTTGVVEVGFGKVVNPRFNTVTVQKGLDIRAGEGSEVTTVAEGTVVYAGWLKGYGNLVIIDHGGSYHSLYAHLANAQVDVGAKVQAGQLVGQVGDTGSLKGSYLYFEIRKEGQAIDPLPWLKPQE